MTHTLRYLCVVALLAISMQTVTAQQFTTTTPTGFPPFSSSAGGPDAIDLSNLNVHIDVPVFSRPGRGTNFTYDLSYDSSIWVSVTSGSSHLWLPVNNWGWRGLTEVAMGFVSANVTNVQDCYIFKNGQMIITGHEYQYDHWVYHDNFGVAHPVAGSTLYVNSVNCPDTTTSFPKTASTDGSGYALQATGQVGTATSRTGAVVLPPTNISSGPGAATDRNGNQLTVDASGHYFDALSNITPVLTVGGSGTPSLPFTYTYTPPGAASANYSMKFIAYTVQTNFGCANPTDYPAQANNLVSEIDLPDIAANSNSKYTFTYETTPGDAHSPHYVTGRIATVTLPTGATITYNYSGGNNGINCSDGSSATLTRITPDGTWTYAQVKGSGAASTTTITDPERDTQAPSGNQTVIQFQGIYETQRQVKQGVSTLLQTTNACYNASASPCTTTAIVLPIGQVDRYVQLPGSSNLIAKHTSKFNTTYGMQTEQDDYDYGSGAPGSLLQKTVATYNTSLGNGLVSFPQQITVSNAAGTTVAQTTISYDGSAVSASGATQLAAVSGSRGNATTVTSLVQGATNLTKTFTYFDTGNVKTATDVNGAVTTYNFPDTASTCNFAFPASVTEPMSLSRSMTWNCAGGVQATSKDENNQTTTTGWGDPYFWRPNSVTDQTSAFTNLWYNAQLAFEAYMPFNTTSSSDSLSVFDGLGRTKFSQRRQTPAGTAWDSVETDYDSLGRPARVTVPYPGTWGQPSSPPAPATTTTYDALNRPLLVTDGGGGTTSYTYSQNDVLVTIGPLPTGENTKRRQLEYDAL